MNKWLDLRPPSFDVAFIAVGFLLASTYFIVTGGDSWFTTWVCPFFLPIGIGLWLKHGWARWISFAFFSVALVGAILLFYKQGVTGRSALRAFVVVGSLFSLWNWDAEYPEEREGEEA